MSAFSADLAVILPELLLAVMGMVLLLWGAFRGNRDFGVITVAAALLMFAAAALAIVAPTGNGFNSLFVNDAFARFSKVVIFAVPGAFTPTCHSAHVPSFVRTKEQFDAKGVDEIICLSCNDPFVMQAWGEATGATEAGITMLADASSAFTRAIASSCSCARRFRSRTGCTSGLVASGGRA